MRIAIARVPISDLDSRCFRSDYDAPGHERPVLVTNVAIPDPSRLTFDDFCAKYLPGAIRSKAWYDAPLPPGPVAEMALPEIVRDVLSSPDVAVRPRPVRLWAHPAGHRTLFHYDGNSVSSFNLQLKGRKRWTLVSPNTPLPFHPFQLAGAVSSTFVPRAAKHDFYMFDTVPGDMLFVPRYWAHGVVSCEDVNLNMNWVWTPRRPSDSALGRRESELLALRTALPFVERLFFDTLAGYGGDDAIVATYADSVGRSRMVRRLAKELSAAPRSLLALPDLLRQLKAFSSNSFNLKSETARAANE